MPLNHLSLHQFGAAMKQKHSSLNVRCLNVAAQSEVDAAETFIAASIWCSDQQKTFIDEAQTFNVPAQTFIAAAQTLIAECFWLVLVSFWCSDECLRSRAGRKNGAVGAGVASSEVEKG